MKRGGNKWYKKIGLFDGAYMIEMGKVVVGNGVTRLKGECK
jgi:hypothetical protein